MKLVFEILWQEEEEFQHGISVHHRVCVSRRHITNPAPLSVVPLAVPRARLLNLMPQSHSSCVSAHLPFTVFS